MPKAEYGPLLMTPGGVVERDTAVSTDTLLWGDPVSVALCIWLQGLSTTAQPRSHTEPAQLTRMQANARVRELRRSLLPTHRARALAASMPRSG